MVDKAAYVCAHRHSREYAMAVFDSVVFHAPVHVGELVTFFTPIVGVGHTLMQVEIRVISENLKTCSVQKVSTCFTTMVTMRVGKKIEAPPLVCESIQKHRDCLKASLRRELSLEYSEEMEDGSR